jgi:CRP/FNR family transcriptional regulator, anaerobic regulatory protein
MVRRAQARTEPKGRRPKIIATEFCAAAQRRPLLDNLLSPAEQAALAEIATILTYQAGGAAIFTEGEDAHFLYLIDEGVVRICRTLPDGARQVLGFMWPGDMLGLVEAGRYVNAAETLTPATLFRLPLERLERLLLSEPSLQLHMLIKAAHELRRAQRQLIVLGQLNNAKRLASFLVDIRQHVAFFESSTGLLRLPMSRFDIADYLGTSPESVARAFAALERAGLVRRASPRVVHLLDPDALARFVRGIPPN